MADPASELVETLPELGIDLAPLGPDDPAVVGGMEMLGRLGEGGMGRVYLGRTAAGRPVAVKLVKDPYATDPSFRARFAREAANAAKVSGLFTAPVLSHDADAERPWLATAFVPGPNLAVAVARHGVFPVRGVWRLAAGIAEALKAIHAAGITHRDLKPGNVLLASDGPRVIDFGISRAEDDHDGHTQTGIRMGTPSYMSPELLRGEPLTPAADIFALGSVIAYAAGGSLPFHAPNDAALVYRITQGEPDLTAVTDPDVRDLILSCLAKNPADRPSTDDVIAAYTRRRQSASWLPADLATALTGAHPDSPAAPPNPARGTAPGGEPLAGAAASPAAQGYPAPEAAENAAAPQQVAPRDGIASAHDAGHANPAPGGADAVPHQPPDAAAKAAPVHQQAPLGAASAGAEAEAVDRTTTPREVRTAVEVSDVDGGEPAKSWRRRGVLVGAAVVAILMLAVALADGRLRPWAEGSPGAQGTSGAPGSTPDGQPTGGNVNTGGGSPTPGVTPSPNLTQGGGGSTGGGNTGGGNTPNPGPTSGGGATKPSPVRTTGNPRPSGPFNPSSAVIVNVADGTVLTASGTGSGSNVNTANWNGSNGQRWKFTSSGDGGWTIHPKSALGMQLANDCCGSMELTGAGGIAYKWYFDSATGEIRNYGGGSCLSSNGAGQQAQLILCGNASKKKWKLVS